MGEENIIEGYFRNGQFIENSNKGFAHTLEILPNENELPFVMTRNKDKFNPLILLDGNRLKCVKKVEICLEAGEWIEARITMVCHVKGKIPFIEKDHIVKEDPPAYEV